MEKLLNAGMLRSLFSIISPFVEIFATFCDTCTKTDPALTIFLLFFLGNNINFLRFSGVRMKSSFYLMKRSRRSYEKMKNNWTLFKYETYNLGCKCKKKNKKKKKISAGICEVTGKPQEFYCRFVFQKFSSSIFRKF